MRTIRLTRMEISAFKSFRQITNIMFGTTAGLQYLTGQNLVEPRLGANGAGKTALLDALVWCLYGTSSRGQRASDLVSWGAQGRPRVSTWISIEQNGEIEEYQIDRLGNPDLLTIDSAKVEQDAITPLLGLSRPRFLHSVLFGQGARLLIDLSQPERAALLDEVLDLGLWLKASRVAENAALDHEKTIRGHEARVTHAGGILQGLGDEQTLVRESDLWEAAYTARMDAAIDRVAAAEAELEDKARAVRAARAAAASVDQTVMREANKTVVACEDLLRTNAAKYQRSMADMQILTGRLSHLKNNPKCPMCGVVLSKTSRAAQIQELETQITVARGSMQQNGAEQNSIEQRLATVRAERDKLQRRYEFHRDGIADKQAQHDAHLRIIDSLVQQAEQIGEEQNPVTARLASWRVRRDAALAEQYAAGQDIIAESAERDTARFWADAFKRTRLFLIGRILAHLEIEVGAAASALGLPDWRIQFMTESETKSGTIKHGVQIKVSSPVAQGNWEVWSGGEAQRIRLAVAMGFAALIQRMAGVHFSFELWDEPSNWLAGDGVDDMVECLRHRAMSTQKAVWLIDHRAISHTFDAVWCVVKSEDGSKIERLR